MAVYFILMLSAVCIGIPLCGLDGRRNGRAVSVYCIAAAVVLTAVSALRFGVGYDYNLYAGWYYELNFVDFGELRGGRQEIGFMLPMKMLNDLFGDYIAAFPLISLMIYPPLAVYIRRCSGSAGVSLAAFLGMGLFFNSMNFMRQFIAAVICAYAFDYALKGSKARFFLMVLFASCFHRSALFLLPCLLFLYIDWSRVTLIITAALSAVCLAFSDKLLGFATNYIYSGYSAENADVANGLPAGYAVMYGVLFIAAYFLKDRFSGDKQRTGFILWCCFASFFFELIGIRHAIVSRLALLFFIPAVCLGVPEICSAIYGIGEERKEGYGKRFAAVVPVLLTVSFALLLSVNYNGVVPYRTIFERADMI